MDVGVERQHRRRVVGGGIGVGQTAAERAAIADLRIADRCRGLGQHGTCLLQQRRCGHVVVDGAGADFDRVVLLADPGQARNASDVDQRLRLAQTKLHERDQTVTAGDELPLAIGRAKLRERVVQRRGPAVLECRRYHDRPP